MGDLNLKHWEEMSISLVENGNHSKRLGTERPGRLITETEKDGLEGHTVEIEARVLL